MYKKILKGRKLVKLTKVLVVFVEEGKHKFSQTKRQKEKVFRIKHGHCSFMSTSAWCDLKHIGPILKVHIMCPNVNVIVINK